MEHDNINTIFHSREKMVKSMSSIKACSSKSEESCRTTSLGGVLSIFLWGGTELGDQQIELKY